MERIQNAVALLVRAEEWYNFFLVKVLQFLIELNAYLPYDPEILFIDIYLREVKVYVHYSFINNTQRLETAQMLIWRRINKQTVVYPQNVYSDI